MRSVAELMRAARESSEKNEHDLLDLRRAYLETRAAAEAALEAVGNLEGVTQAEHDDLARKQAGMLVAELLEINLNERREEFAQKWRNFSDVLSDDRPARAAKSRGERDAAIGDIAAADELLHEVSDARWKVIDAYRENIDISGDPDAVRECCALLEAEIALCSVIGNAERAAQGAEVLRGIQAQVERLNFKHQEAVEGPADVAKAVVASLLTEGKIPMGDAVWFQGEITRQLTENSKIGDIWDRATDATRAAMSTYREKQLRAGPVRRPEDPKGALLGNKARF